MALDHTGDAASAAVGYGWVRVVSRSDEVPCGLGSGTG